MKLQCTEIQLGGKNGGIAIVSQEDFDVLSKYNWRKSDEHYVRGNVNGKQVNMHSFIMKAIKGQQVDHINGIRYDNRRCNLRFLPALLNSQNQKKQKRKKETTSKFRGICVIKGKYQASMNLDGICHYLGKYNTEAEAVDAWEMFVVHNKLDHIQLNYPDKRNEYLSRKYIPYVSKRKKCQYTGVATSVGKKGKINYIVSITIKKKLISIGSSPDQIKAAQMYDDYVVQHKIFGKQLNFPDRYPDYCKEKKIRTLCVDINPTTVKLLLTYKDDKIATIDKSDYDKVKYYKCTIIKKGYVQIKIKNKSFLLHRFLMGASDPEIPVDHIDENKLNNTTANLRMSDPQKNSQNKSKRTGLTSKYIGVSYDKKIKKWVCSVAVNYKTVFASRSTEEELCARARDLYIITNLKNEHFKLNFKWTKNDIAVWEKKVDIMKRDKTSSYIGVSFDKRSEKWKSAVNSKNKTLFSGRYATSDLAARARDLYIIINNIKSTAKGRFKMNFEWSKNDIAKWKKTLNM